jgi:hypothetical protein
MTDELSKSESDKLERMGAAFDKIDALLLRLGQQGLQRASRSSAVELQALQQTAHNAALVSLERQIDLLAAQIQRYLDGSPLFTMEGYVHAINRIWLLNKKARERYDKGETPEQMKDVVGELRRSYEDREAPLTLQAVGAHGWVTDTDFVGVTIHFVSPDDDRIYEASNAKPTMYFGKDPRRLLPQSISEAVTHSIHQLSHGAFVFRHAKVSRDARLSIHKELEIGAAPSLGLQAYARFVVGDWIVLAERLRAGEVHPVGGTGEQLVLVQPSRIEPVVIDQKHARATAIFRDGRGAPLRLEVPLRAENNFLVDNLIKVTSTEALRPSSWLGVARVREGALTFFPYTALYEQGITLQSGRRAAQQVNELHLSLETLEEPA